MPKLSAISDAAAFATAMMLVVFMLGLGQIALTLLPAVVALLAGLVLAARFGLLGRLEPRRLTC